MTDVLIYGSRRVGGIGERLSEGVGKFNLDSRRGCLQTHAHFSSQHDIKFFLTTLRE